MENFSLEEFVKKYVGFAFDALKIGEPCTFEEFERTLFGRISKEMNLTREFILHMHHAFHWSFFTTNKFSPLKYSFSRELDGKEYILLDRDSFDERNKIFDFIFGNYMVYLRARLSSYRKDIFNTPLQLFFLY